MEARHVYREPEILVPPDIEAEMSQQKFEIEDDVQVGSYSFPYGKVTLAFLLSIAILGLVIMGLVVLTKTKLIAEGLPY